MDIIELFKNAMRDADITPPDTIIADGILHRFHIEGDRDQALNGWYKLHSDGLPAGAFGCWKRDVKHVWKQESKFKPYTDAERKAYKQTKQRQAIEHQKAELNRHKTALNKAAFIWNNSIPAATHPYRAKKNIQAHSERFYKGALVIPLYNENKEMTSVQFINEDGSKRMMKGGITKACFFWVGKFKKDTEILICEGWATAASLYEHTGFFTVVAFFAGNLKAVALVIHELYPNSSVVICGDNDANGTGQRTAKDAALAVSGRYLIPAEEGKDWNDVLAFSQAGNV